MGLFSDLKAMNDLQQIKHGGVGKLSLSQIITLNNKYNDLCMRKMQDKVVSE